MSYRKTIMVTGGAGFIGSHLCRTYLDEGHRVICVDNLQTTRTPKNIVSLMGRAGFTFIQHDVINPLIIREKIDWIFNFACSGSYTSYQFDPVHTVKTNTVGVINMLELARTHGARLMQASTSEVYGDPTEVPQRESYWGNVNTLGPRACYDEGKRVAETLCMDYFREYGTDIKIIRIFNTYGPCMDPNDGRVVTNFIIRALAGEDLVMYGDGTATRSFQYIDDLILGIDAMMKKENFIGPVNLGNPGELTMKELAEKVLLLTGSVSSIRYERAATDDPKRRCPDIALAERVLGWKPRVALDEGLPRTIEYFKAVKKPERKVLVFTTTYHPHIGPAEEALIDLSAEMPEASFHVVTARQKGTLPSYEKDANTEMHRVGIGSFLDKYLLPIVGLVKAMRLHNEHDYTFVWGIMGSYSGISARFLKMLYPHLILFISLDESELVRQSYVKRKVYQYVTAGADAVFVRGKIKGQFSFLPDQSRVSFREGNAKSFMMRTRALYAELLNARQQKLARPK